MYTAIIMGATYFGSLSDRPRLKDYGKDLVLEIRLEIGMVNSKGWG